MLDFIAVHLNKFTYVSKKSSWLYVGKVSLGFKFLQPRFAILPELALNEVELDAELNGWKYLPKRPFGPVLELEVALFCGQPTLKVVLFDAEFDFASNSTSLRVNSGKMANWHQKYLPKRPFGPVLEVQVALFCGQHTLKVVPFDAEFDFTSNSTSFRINSGKMANRDRKYLPKRPFGPLLEVQVALFCRQPTLKVVPFDAEFDSAYNSTSLRVNSGKMTNRG